MATKVSAPIGDKQISIETGKLAKQADGAVTVCAADGSDVVRVPFKVYGQTHKTTRGYYLCLSSDGTLYLSNYSDGATIYRMGSGDRALTPFTPTGFPDGISPAKNLRIEGTKLVYDLMDGQGNVTGSGSVPLG